MKWTELYFKIEIISGVILTIVVLLYCLYVIISDKIYEKKIRKEKNNANKNK